MRLDYSTVMPEAPAAMQGVEQVVHDSGLDPLLLGLVKLRASQINGRAFCVAMHTEEARVVGEGGARPPLG